jgi:hypothetical protein
VFQLFDGFEEGGGADFDAEFGVDGFDVFFNAQPNMLENQK